MDGRDPTSIGKARVALSEGDALRATGAFEQFIARYQKALKRAEMKLIDSPIVQGATGGADGAVAEVFVAAGGAIELKCDPVDDDVAEHQVIDARAEC